MKIDDAVRAAFRGLVARPSGYLPYYFLGLSTPAIAQTVWLVGLVGSYLTLRAQGRLAELREVLEGAETIPLDDPLALTEGHEETLQALAEAAYSPELLAVMAATLLAVLAALLALDAVASAGQIHAVYATLRERAPVRAGVDGIADDYLTFLALRLLEIVLIGAAGVVLFGAVGLLAPVPGLAALAALAWVGAALLLHLLFVFAPQAVVVDGAGALGAIRGNLGFVRSNPLTTVLYGAFVVAVGVAVVVVAAALSLIQASGAVSLLLALAVVPLLDFVKTVLYADHATGAAAVPRPAERGAGARFVRAFRDGLSELRGFVGRTPGLHALSAAVFLLSGVASWFWARSIEPHFEASIALRLESLSVIGAFVGFATNNWQVAVAQAYGGLAAGIPTIVTLFYNGALLGVLFRLERAPAELAAFVVPHGIVEIPSLIISGALGLYLGAAFLSAVRGRRDRAAVADAVGRAYRVLVGLAVLFVIAAAIEAFVSPFYTQFVGLP